MATVDITLRWLFFSIILCMASWTINTYNYIMYVTRSCTCALSIKHLCILFLCWSRNTSQVEDIWKRFSDCGIQLNEKYVNYSYRSNMHVYTLYMIRIMCVQVFSGFSGGLPSISSVPAGWGSREHHRTG